MYFRKLSYLAILGQQPRGASKMDNRVRNENGYSLIEITLVMALLALFGVSTYTLAASGVSYYEKNQIESESQFNQRIALSYLVNRVRQSDIYDSLHIEETSAGQTLVISQTISGEVYRTWIYHYNGFLCELLIPQSLPFAAEEGIQLVELSGLSFSQPSTGHGIQIKVWNDEPPTKLPPLQVFLHLKSAL